MLKELILKFKNKEIIKYFLWKSGLKNFSNLILRNLNKIYLSKAEFLGIDKYELDKNLNIEEFINQNYDGDSRLFEILTSNKDKELHKWLHYIPIYENYLSKYIDKNVGFLEIGVSKGGSLQMFRKFLGKKATLFGIDIDTECLKFNGVDGQVRIGDQKDIVFLNSVVQEIGSLDIVLDDGSHVMKDIKTTFLYLFRYLNEGGLYIIEDLHTSYWKKFGGGYNNKNNFFKFLQILINDMHHWYHDFGQSFPEISNYIPAIHVYDSVVVIEKKAVRNPVQTRIF